jgi:hypothetical protein
MMYQLEFQLKLISLLSGYSSSLLTLTREPFHGGVKTRLVERNCNLRQKKICSSEEQISYLYCHNIL